MQQIKLTEFNESYAVSIDHALPENEAVFFKTIKGETHKGEFFKFNKHQTGSGHFDNLKGHIFTADYIVSWHPVTVDL